jgi:hypothetical protein
MNIIGNIARLGCETNKDDVYGLLGVGALARIIDPIRFAIISAL